MKIKIKMLNIKAQLYASLPSVIEQDFILLRKKFKKGVKARLSAT